MWPQRPVPQPVLAAIDPLACPNLTLKKSRTKLGKYLVYDFREKIALKDRP